jgi:hypothetical protein
MHVRDLVLTRPLLKFIGFPALRVLPGLAGAIRAIGRVGRLKPSSEEEAHRRRREKRGALPERIASLSDLAGHRSQSPFA